MLCRGQVREGCHLDCVIIALLPEKTAKWRVFVREPAEAPPVCSGWHERLFATSEPSGCFNGANTEGAWESFTSLHKPRFRHDPVVGDTRPVGGASREAGVLGALLLV